VELALSDRFVNLVEEGVDVAHSYWPSARFKSDRTPIGKHTYGVCASPGYLEQHGKPLTADDLGNHNCLTYSRSKVPRRLAAQEHRLTDESGRVSGRFATN